MPQKCCSILKTSWNDKKISFAGSRLHRDAGGIVPWFPPGSPVGLSIPNKPKSTTKAAIFQSPPAKNYGLSRKWKSPYREGDTGFCEVLAEGGGFEPPVPIRVRQFSKLVVSATHPSFQRWCRVERRFSKRSAKISRIFETANFFALFYFTNNPYFCWSYLFWSRRIIGFLW